ncbi:MULTISPECIES: RNA polymerase factor sigma-54 [Bhargavaea]|uniref:RNA polymerase factor sigma-54 n=1 Tax=Bhargavaea changchunensis TaxID=2134037 RepID=A0ABW2NEQ5_9BACL|nr:RNA polymerase factor sigma-54 [Bhargavaea sp. CC-171006]
MQLTMTQRQELKLIMTMELRQAIELLQYSTFELEQFIREQEAENPLIELKERDDTGSYDSPFPKVSGGEGLKTDWIKAPDALYRDDLVSMVRLTYSDEDSIRLLSYLIQNLDDNGYLILPEDCKIGEDLLTLGIRMLQEIGPSGIGARNLQECLLLQLDEESDSLARQIVSHCFSLLASRKWKEIAQALQITLADVKSAVDQIQTLNPKPCSLINDQQTDYTFPDVIVTEREGNLEFLLNDGHLPEVKLNSDYLPYLNAKDEVGSYLAERHKQYRWLLNSLEQRRETLIKIVRVLAEKQQAFFIKGPEALNPLTMREVAEEIGMHESTISRATANKIIKTPSGTFEMKSLFTSKLESADGLSVSQSKVKSLLRKYIDQENKSRPLSDQKLAERLKDEQGITVSRRTISKYREEMNIPSSAQRKDIVV